MPKDAPDAVHQRLVPNLESYSYMPYGSRTFAFCSPGVLLLIFACSGPQTEPEGREPVQCREDCDAGPDHDSDVLTPPDVEIAKPLPGDHLFSDAEVLRFDFTLAADKWQDLQEHGNAEEYVQAALELGSNNVGVQAFATVGLRHKGSWTLHHCWDDNGGVRSYIGECAKLSLKVKFDKYDSDGRLDGLKRLNLHALQTDQVKMRELLAYATYRDFGVKAPRVLPARVTVNGELLGLFMAVEAIDGRFTKAHFPSSGDGNLYKETWPHASFDADEFLSALRTNEEAGDVSAMLAFAQAIDRATTDDFRETVESHLDITNTLRFLAVDRAINNWDGVMAFYQPEKPHNFYWYHDQGHTDLFRLVPWDLDNALGQDWFTDPDVLFGVAPVPDWNQKPLDCNPRSVWEPGGVSVTPPRCDKLLDLIATEYWSEYATIGQELLAGPFTAEALQAKVDNWLPLLAPLVEEDPLLDAAQWQAQAAQWRDEMLPQLVDEFSAFLEQGLMDEPEADPPFAARPPEGIATQDLGFSVFEMNSFEFTDGVAGSEPQGIAYWTDDVSTASPVWNTSDPIDGEADLRINLTFSHIEGAWNEFIGVGYYGDPGDVSGASHLVVSMAAVPPRRVRLALASPVFEDEFGGAWPEFAAEVAVDSEPKEFALPLSAFLYLDWARDAWEAGQGWSMSDEAARELVLRHLNGVVFNPLAGVDPAGELVGEEDSGWLQIDRLYFQ